MQLLLKSNALRYIFSFARVAQRQQRPFYMGKVGISEFPARTNLASVDHQQIAALTWRRQQGQHLPDASI